jgi:tetratricopeptide (TPR) repeat protein
MLGVIIQSHPTPVVAPKPRQESGGMFRSPAKRNLVLGLLLVMVTLALYNPVTRNGFVGYDDEGYVTDNPHVQAGLSWGTISWAFTTWDQANWHPLTWLSHALDCQLFRLNAAGHHYTSLLLHAMNALVLFLILQWFTGYTGRSLMVAALFALHPLNVESVAWVAERKNVLCMLFLLLALAGYGWYVRRPGVLRYLVVAIFFAAGLMSKPMVITLPLLLLLLDYWPLGRMSFAANEESHDQASRSGLPFAASTQPVSKLCLEKIPLLVLSAASAAITMIAQSVGGAVVSTATISPLLRLENAIVCYMLYIEKTVWPSHLVPIYPFPHALPKWQVASSALFLLAVTWAVLKYRESRYLLVGWFWFLGTMVPMIGLVQVGNQAMADRYAYLPLIGLFVMIVWAAGELASVRHIKAKYVVTAGLAVLCGLSAVTRIQMRYWQDGFKLWSHTLAVSPLNFVAENNLAVTLIKHGRRDEAIPHFRTAAALEPADPTSQLNLGIYAQEQGDLKQAATRYELVLELTTNTQLRASAYSNLGSVYFALRDYTRAQQNYEAALKLDRVSPIVLRDLGLIAEKTGDWNQAIYYFARLVSAEPSDVGYLLLSHALYQGKRVQEAQLSYQQALRFSTDINQAQQRASQLMAE